MKSLVLLLICIIGARAGNRLRMLINIGRTLHDVGLFSRYKCTPVPSHLCALVYDDGNCRGWKLEIPVGDKQFKVYDGFWYR